MTLRIDPHLTFAWRSTEELQLGAPRARARVRIVDDLELRAIDLLRVGTRQQDWDTWVSQQPQPGAKERLDTLLAQLRPALTSDRSVSLLDSVSVGIQGDPELVRYSTPIVRQLGYEVSSGNIRPDVTLVVANHVLAPEHYRTLLQSDWPHLPIVSTDSGIEVGPLVNPGVTSCAYCLDQSRIDADEAWPAIAMQLRRRRGGRHSPLLWHAALVFTGFLLERLRQQQPVTDRLYTVMPNGTTSMRVVKNHPNCGCRTLSRTEKVSTAEPVDHSRARPPARAAHV